MDELDSLKKLLDGEKMGASQTMDRLRKDLSNF